MRSEQAKSARASHDALKKRSSTSAPISLEDLMDKEVLDLFLSASWLGRPEFSCSLHMILVMEGARKEKKGLDFFACFWKILLIC